MMSLWAPNATFTSARADRGGKEQIRQFWLTKSEVFKPETHWISDTPRTRSAITVNGDRGTLYFECHYVDAKTGKLAVDHGRRSGRREDQRTLADHQHGGRIATLSPEPCRRRRQRRSEAAVESDAR